ncbi:MULTISPECIES: zinc-binding alcohol dehydrogenase family protein [Shouchella]|uniref:Zinc-type alcohol dehydrogenase-like protein n=1 Tax=Shouchella hunanensis TaxID=766894 RepID=A0ABY7WAK0_9BACI|nr:MULTISPECIES: zinc-binding alcohol dehydrogenase family protein [Shouchella]WDF04649.1 zinc-binding alcohol dehydrogenase family protein [Shouchella hunanensis]GAF21834.1 bifunctional protein: zinc-containing alcohol dehydrogenase [Bacillus sp. JCM 19047]
MKAIGFYKALPIQDQNSLVEKEVETPKATGYDLLIEVKAVSVNPVDTKQRKANKPEEEAFRILGFDGAGIVKAVGDQCTLFQAGDEVYYAGDVTRNGSNAEYQVVDERLVGKKPKSLSFAEAAAMPLTAITAWESLYDRMKVTEKDRGKSILIIGGAGGVGSIAIQLASQQGLTVIATASRQETKEWCHSLGADVVVNHYEDLHTELQANRLESVDYILCLADTNQHWDGMAACIKPQGTICAIVENKDHLDMQKIRAKSVTFSWEFMFTRSMFKTEDQIEQHHMLTKMSEQFDEGKLRHTMTKLLSPLTAETLKQAHKQLEDGKMIGKLVIEQK